MFYFYLNENLIKKLLYRWNMQTNILFPFFRVPLCRFAFFAKNSMHFVHLCVRSARGAHHKTEFVFIGNFSIFFMYCKIDDQKTAVSLLEFIHDCSKQLCDRKKPENEVKEEEEGYKTVFCFPFYLICKIFSVNEKSAENKGQMCIVCGVCFYSLPEVMSENKFISLFSLFTVMRMFLHRFLIISFSQRIRLGLFIVQYLVR